MLLRPLFGKQRAACCEGCENSLATSLETRRVSSIPETSRGIGANRTAVSLRLFAHDDFRAGDLGVESLARRLIIERVAIVVADAKVLLWLNCEETL